MKRDWIPTQAAFDRLLAWLDPERERAAEKYEEIRRRLIKIFACRGCLAPEDAADRTINRVTGKLEELPETYQRDPILYFYAVAKRVHQEETRDARPAPTLAATASPGPGAGWRMSASGNVSSDFRPRIGS